MRWVMHEGGRGEGESCGGYDFGWNCGRSFFVSPGALPDVLSHPCSPRFEMNVSPNGITSSVEKPPQLPVKSPF